MNQIFNFIVKAHDELFLEMNNIRGGSDDDDLEIKCETGRVKCKNNGCIGGSGSNDVEGTSFEIL